MYGLDRLFLIKIAQDACHGPIRAGVSSDQVAAITLALSAARIAFHEEESELLNNDIT
ncbi:MAG TPA: hypothetical protein VIT93_03220 [Dehalococcoidia bacterium]